jgi:hypothetical protein
MKDKQEKKIKKQVKIDNKKAHEELVKQREIIVHKENYLQSIINGRYYFARSNMIANQLIPKINIVEKIDGALKSVDFVIGEYALIKKKAIHFMREANGIKNTLIKEYGLEEKELDDFVENHYKARIITEAKKEELNSINDDEEKNPENNEESKRTYIN